MIYIILIALVIVAITKIRKQKKRDSRSKQLRKMCINEESIEKAIITLLGFSLEIYICPT